MMVETNIGMPVRSTCLSNYFRTLVNRFFKILPIREENEETLVTYMQSLQLEILGCQSLISEMYDDPDYISLLSVLQYLIDNPQISKSSLKREVFGAISICNKLKARYYVSEVSE